MAQFDPQDITEPLRRPAGSGLRVRRRNALRLSALREPRMPSVLTPRVNVSTTEQRDVPETLGRTPARKCGPPVPDAHLPRMARAV